MDSVELQDRLRQLLLKISAGSGPLNQRTRLQRSAMSAKTVTIAKDSTVNVSRFIMDAVDIFLSLGASSMKGSAHWTKYQDFVYHMFFFIIRTFQEVNIEHHKFNEARFQSHLTYGQNMLSRMLDSLTLEDESRFPLETLFTKMQSHFGAGFQLSSGLSMEILWKQLKPAPIQSQDVLSQLIELEMLANRFDSLRWKSGSIIPDLSSVVSRLCQVYNQVRCHGSDAKDLIPKFRAEIQNLEARTAIDVVEQAPVLAKEFDALRQIIALSSLANGEELRTLSVDLFVLASQPSMSLMILHGFYDTVVPLQMLNFLFCNGSETLPWKNVFFPSILKTVTSTSATLASLKLLESELPIIGKMVTAFSASIISEPLEHLRVVANQIIVDLFSFHHHELGTLLQDAIMKPCIEYLRSSWLLKQTNLEYSISQFPKVEKWKISMIEIEQALQTYLSDLPAHFAPLIPELISLLKFPYREDPAAQALVWFKLALALLQLYVPDKPFDPQLRPIIEREFHAQFNEAVTLDIARLEKFQKSFTNQQDSLRRRVLQDLVDRNKQQDNPAPPTCYRPEMSEIIRLQSEFTGMKRSIEATIHQLITDQDVSFKQLAHESRNELREQLHVLEQSIICIIDRLSMGFQEYQDITTPAINIMRCAQVAISLVNVEDQTFDPFGPCTLIPTMGGVLPRLSKFKKFSEQAWVEGHELELLAFLEAEATIAGTESFSIDQRSCIGHLFSSIYQQWSRKLEADRKEEQAKQNLYRFKGSLEEEEEQLEEDFNALFPTYESEDAKNPVTARDITIKVAEAHKNVFSLPRTRHEILENLALTFGRQFEPCSENHKLFTAVLLALHKKQKDLDVSSATSQHNFYLDANLIESRKLVQIVTEIQVRFRSLQLVDEIGHLQPLTDVVTGCDRVLELGHEDPLAKLITRVERLHGLVYEWQFGGWAPGHYGALPLYNRLTELIVSWRRLELSTWGRLFEMEINKAKEDAMAWWFIAYGAIIEEPMAIITSQGDLSVHAASLIARLEQYFASATLGQFETRLAMINQLVQHLRLIEKDSPQIFPILSALCNFSDIFTNFLAPVQDSIRAGRAPLEKQVKDVLLMASWRDTNILALKESARKSHQKLFRLVRKFRDLLAQPVKPIIEQGIQELVAPPIQKPVEIQITKVNNQDALAKCAVIPGWIDSNKRLVHTDRTLGIMVQASFIDDSLYPPQLIASFSEDLKGSITKLREETPETLTDDNKKAVSYLKARKRRLFADTLKSVRQMGFKFNLSTVKLDSQCSLPTILVRTGYFTDKAFPSIASAIYHSHRMFDSMPRVRETIYGHSEDLNGAEVSRSIGFLEGILDVILIQQQVLSENISSLNKLDKIVEQAWNIGMTTRVTPVTRVDEYRRQVSWTETALRFGRHLVDIHVKLNGSTQPDVLPILDTWIREISEVQILESKHPLIPDFMTTLDQDQKRNFWVNEGVLNLRNDLITCAERQPEFSWVMSGIINFVLRGTEAPQPMEDTSDLEITDICKNIAIVADKTLRAIENLKAAAAKLPKSHEESAWLTDYSSGLLSCVAALHVKEIISNIEKLLNSLILTSFEARSAFPALIAMIAPLLRQYTTICRHIIERLAELHASTCELGHSLSKIFTRLASQGFCAPQETSDEKSKESGKLEGGTGLGDERGVNDISKDIQEDEDLSELAQQPQNEKKEDGEEIEDEKDAVDMADEELEGEMGDKEVSDDENNDKDEDEDDTFSDEAGDVDDLDPNAVDEKLWDGETEEGEKEQKGEKKSGKPEEEEQAADNKVDSQEKQERAPEEGSMEDEDENVDEEDGEEGLEEQDIKPQAEAERQDENVLEEEALDLPEDMEIDGEINEASESEDELDGLEDDGDGNLNDEADDKDEEMDSSTQSVDNDQGLENQVEDDKKAEGSVEMENEAQDDESMDSLQEKEEQEHNTLRSTDNIKSDQENAAPNNEQGTGLDQFNDQNQEDDNFRATAAQQADGNAGEGETQKEATAGKDGAVSRSSDIPEEQGKQEDKENEITQPFKKLGDALEQWHRQQKEILAAPQDKQDLNPFQDQHMGYHEFQHLQDENAQEDTQALGGAQDDEAKPFDESMAIDPDNEDNVGRKPPTIQDIDDEDKMDVDEEAPSSKSEIHSQKLQEERDVPNSAIQKGSSRLLEEEDDLGPNIEGAEEIVEEASTQLSATHLDDDINRATTIVPFAEALQRWSHFQARTHMLSLSLTSQLRLILTPSQTTKLSGGFRTGKRLNIKRIIPYIASSYKRDKIWMRRAIPTKRAYQVLVAVDDSQSMRGSGSGSESFLSATLDDEYRSSSPASMALESLVMLARSLAMLEVGQVGVLGFGRDTFVAHALSDPPLTSPEAGARALSKFGFGQTHTDVPRLLQQTVDLFIEARNSQVSSGGGNGNDLWQLAIVLSDGMAGSETFDPIRRILREANERRIMVVFIVLDAAASSSSASVGGGNNNNCNSILTLKQAKMVRDERGNVMGVRIERYLDAFPFSYYLIIRDMAELPNALAGLLRQWFDEVNS